jgi:acyl dehydratase
MYAGYQFPEVKKEEITHTQLVKYAGASGDFNPIHTVEPIAQLAGLGGVIAHGMLIMGFVGQAIGTWFPVQDLERFKVRFQAMTRPGEAITVKGQIKDETETSWKCEAVAVNEKDEVKLKVTFEVKKMGRGI